MAVRCWCLAGETVLHRDTDAVSPNLDEVAGDVAASNVQSAGQMWQCKAVIDWTNVGDAITRVNYHTRLQA